MEIDLPLDRMSNLDKIAIMEKLWDNLCQNPESIPSPEWHQKVLSEREVRIREGKAEFIPFHKAKDRIKDKIK